MRLFLALVLVALAVAGCVDSESEGESVSESEPSPTTTVTEDWEYSESAAWGSVTWTLRSTTSSKWELPQEAPARKNYKYPPLATLRLQYQCATERSATSPPHPKVSVTFRGDVKLDFPDTDWWGLHQRQKEHLRAQSASHDDWTADVVPALRWEAYRSKYPFDHPVWFEEPVSLSVGRWGASTNVTGTIFVEVTMAWPEGEPPDDGLWSRGPEPTPDGEPSRLSITADLGDIYRKVPLEMSSREAKSAWRFIERNAEKTINVVLWLDDETYEAEFFLPPLEPPLWEAEEVCDVAR